MSCSNLQIDKTTNSLISFLQTTKWYYFLDTNDNIEIKCTIPDNQIFANDEEKLTYLLNQPWPLPANLHFTHQKLWDLALKIQSSKQNMLPTLLNDDQQCKKLYDYLHPENPFFTYLNSYSELNLLTILFNYKYMEIKVSTSDIPLIPTIEFYLTKKIFSQNDYLTIIRQCLLNVDFNPSCYDEQKDTFTDPQKKEIEPFIKLKKKFMIQYPTLAQSPCIIKNYFSFILQNPSTSLPKIPILLNHLDLSHLDLSDRQLDNLFIKNQQCDPKHFDFINDKIQYIYNPKTFDPFRTLINFQNQNIEMRKYLYISGGNQVYNYDYYLFFHDIKKLSLHHNPNLKVIPLRAIRRVFPNLQTISVDSPDQLKDSSEKINIDLICSNKLSYTDTFWNEGKIKKNIINHLDIILHKLDTRNRQTLQALYVNAYISFFCCTNYFHDLNKEIMLKTIALFGVYAIATLFTENNISIFYDSSIKKTSLLLLIITTILLQINNSDQGKHAQKITWSRFCGYWLCARLFFMTVNYILLSYYIQKCLTLTSINKEMTEQNLFYFIFVIYPLYWLEKNITIMICDHDQFIPKLIVLFFNNFFLENFYYPKCPLLHENIRLHVD
ncbi:hypothetical protein EKK58_10785 [Candidatus Dependentiae bacterium]|nr:MAG: hypothetical protein EKK58_10785 [Candidatus Dependentiae bacterium]